MSSSPSPTRARAALRRPLPTTARGPRYSVIASAAFHGAIIAAALFTFHRNFATPQDSHVVPVDLVTIADETNVQAMAPKPAPEKLETPQPQPPEPPPEPQLQEAEPAPEMDMPKFDVAKDKPKPVEKPEAKKLNFNDLLNKLTAPEKPVKNARQGPRVIQQQGLGNAMTADLVSALQSQIYQCWNVQSLQGAPNADDLVVDFDVRLNPDGTVGSVRQLTMGGNSYTLAAADAAKRAIATCQPYHLPARRYKDWQEINPLHFDPRQMMQ